MKLGSTMPYFQPGTIFDRLEYARQVGLDFLMVSFWTPVDEAHLHEVRQKADELEIELGLAIRSLDPYSTSNAMAADELVPYAEKMLRWAHILGSATVRTAIGSRQDRRTPQPLEAHIKAMTANILAVKELATELGIKIAIENHAGDVTARELRTMVEAAGPDFVGVCIDTSNPVWLAESPFTALEILAPYIMTSHIRDMSLWEHPRGAAWQLQPMGDGNFGIKAWCDYYIEHCPEAPFVLELYTGRPPVIINFLEPAFWQDIPEARGADLAAFVKLIKGNQPFMGPMLTTQSALRDGGDHIEGYVDAIVLQERLHYEQSVKYCREVLGLGTHEPQIPLAKPATLSPAAYRARRLGLT